MTQHTKTPWKIDPYTDYKTQIYGDKRHIACALSQTSEKFPVSIREAEANAAFIVRAVNSHEALVEALEDIIHAAFEHGNKGLSGKTLDPDGELLGAASAALALAKGSQ